MSNTLKIWALITSESDQYRFLTLCLPHAQPSRVTAVEQQAPRQQLWSQTTNTWLPDRKGPVLPRPQSLSGDAAGQHRPDTLAKELDYYQHATWPKRVGEAACQGYSAALLKEHVQVKCFTHNKNSLPSPAQSLFWAHRPPPTSSHLCLLPSLLFYLLEILLILMPLP